MLLRLLQDENKPREAHLTPFKRSRWTSLQSSCARSDLGAKGIRLLCLSADICVSTKLWYTVRKSHLWAPLPTSLGIHPVPETPWVFLPLTEVFGKNHIRLLPEDLQEKGKATLSDLHFIAAVIALLGNGTKQHLSGWQRYPLGGLRAGGCWLGSPACAGKHQPHGWMLVGREKRWLFEVFSLYHACAWLLQTHRLYNTHMLSENRVVGCMLWLSLPCMLQGCA